MSEGEQSTFTLVFAGDIRAVKGNLFEIETPYGKPIAVGRGNAFDEIEQLQGQIDAVSRAILKEMSRD